MVYTNNNDRLANLLERLVTKKIDERTRLDAAELISELKTDHSHVHLLDESEIEKLIQKWIDINGYVLDDSKNEFGSFFFDAHLFE